MAFAICCRILAASSQALGQTERAAGFESRVTAIHHARLVLSPGNELDAATLVIRDGLIISAGKDAPIPADAEVIDATGLFVYAGFIDAGTSTLIDPGKAPTPVAGRAIDFSRFALAATSPDNRKSLTPEFQAQTALKPEPALLESRRKQGVTAVHVLPAGRIASGQSVLLGVAGGPLREAAIPGTAWLEFQLFGPRQSGYPATLMGATAHLRQAFLDARRHNLHRRLYERAAAGVARPPVDPALEALGQLIEQRRPLAFAATTRDEIHRAIDFAQEQELPVILWGARDAAECAARIREAGAGVVVQVNWGEEPKVEPAKPAESLTPALPDPTRVQVDHRDLWRAHVAVLKSLAAEKIRFALCTEGLPEPADLLKAVRQAIKAGVPRDAALAALTRDAAALLGRETRLGTLTAGSLAHVVVMTAPFDDEQSKVRYVFADGARFEYNKPPDAPATAAPVAELAGTWTIAIDSADGKTAATWELVHSGNSLNGRFHSAQGDGKVVSATIAGGQLNLVVAIGAGAQVVELRFTGATADARNGKLNGTLKSAFGAATKWTAQRVPPLELARPAPKNPVEIQLDAATDEKPPPIPVAEGPPPVVAGAGELPTELESNRRNRPMTPGGNLCVRNGTVFTGQGEPLANCSILIRQGKIAAIGPDLAPDEGMPVIDAAGRFVMPGIIDTHSHIMFADGMPGVNEATLSIVPEVRVIDVLKTDDPAEYRALAGGVTAVRLLHGSANVIGGQDVVVKLKYGELARKHVVSARRQGVKFALGENVKFQTERFPNTRLGVEATLNRAFMEALDYRRQWADYRRASAPPGAAEQLLPPRRDLRLEALAALVDQQMFIHCHCYRADEILMLLRTAEHLGMRVRSLQHVLEGYKVAHEIAAHQASCSTFSDWQGYKVEAYDATPLNAALLQAAGANVVLKSDDAELMRHLYQEAAKMGRYGDIAPDAALRMITLNAARELDLDAQLGSIEVGKDADLALFNGHPLNAFSRCEMTIIDGEVVFLREQQPSAMSPAAAVNSAHPGPFTVPSRAVRDKRLDLTLSAARRYAIVNVAIHPVEGAEVERGTIVIEGDRITAVGANVEIPREARVIDADGLHAYPGLIDSGTVLGLTEIGKVQETHDFQETGLFQPDLRAGVALNPDSELIPVARAGGITTALIRPTGGVIAGQCSLIKLDGWIAPDLVLDYTTGLQINWPATKEAPRVEKLREFLAQGRLYAKLRNAAVEAKTEPPISDPRFEALAPYLAGQKRVFVEANTRQEIAEAILFSEKEGLKIVVTGGLDAWKVATDLKERSIPVIVGPVMQKPAADYDPFDAPYANPGRLHEAGVEFCIRSNNGTNSRNAPFEAATAVAYGLPADAALRALTISAAKILHVDDRLGTLQPGKTASLVITDGSPLQPYTQYKAVFIAGRPHEPSSRQTRLYEKYRARLSDPSTPAP